MIERLELHTADGHTLEARRDLAEDPRATVVFCHPHPLHGGTMMAPLMVAVTTSLVSQGLNVLRFNFRGTGSSTGSHEAGEGELEDIDAAAAVAGDDGLPLRLAGWSFGAAMAMRWLSQKGSDHPYAGIAPPPDLLPAAAPPGPGRLVVGRRDQVVEVEAIVDYAAQHSIDLLLTSGDHFFHGRGKRIGDLIAQALG